MGDITLPGSAAQAGSPGYVPPATAAGGQTGGGAPDYKALYEDLNTKLGSMGNELGDYRKFFNQITPILEKLDAQPELIKAIVDGKVDAKLAQAAIDGKITISEAVAVTDAHNQVVKDLGKDAKNTSPEEITRLVEEKMGVLRTEINQSIDDKEDLRKFEETTAAFIASRSDFNDYAEQITEWLKDHPSQDDVATAYWAIKGQALEKAQKEGNTEKIAEIMKSLALNASGAGSGGSVVPTNEELADKFVAKHVNFNDL